jgi:hypothetical protein
VERKGEMGREKKNERRKRGRASEKGKGQGGEEVDGVNYHPHSCNIHVLKGKIYLE